MKVDEGTGGRMAARLSGVTSVEATTWIQWLPYSVTIMLPSRSTATPFGKWNCEALPSPLRRPAVPVPASVDTTPCREILRIRCVLMSATMTLPPPSTATP
eukprot:9499391-Pyramimonas_sp.AAC.1